jgi:hypothetical protein
MPNYAPKPVREECTCGQSDFTNPQDRQKYICINCAEFQCMKCQKTHKDCWGKCGSFKSIFGIPAGDTTINSLMNTFSTDLNWKLHLYFREEYDRAKADAEKDVKAELEKLRSENERLENKLDNLQRVLKN